MNIKRAKFSAVIITATFGLSSAAFAQTHPIPSGKKLAHEKCDFGSSKCAGTKAYPIHVGTDYMAPVGKAVKAICDGKVRYDVSRTNDVRNSLLIIEHDCPTGKIYGYYGHLNSSVKGNVKEGQTIGKLRTYGTNNSHLHMGISKQYTTRKWGYQKNTNAFMDFETFLKNAKKASTSPSRPNPPILRRVAQTTDTVALTWTAITGGTNYRIQIAKRGTSWSPENGFRRTVVNDTKVRYGKNKRYVGYQWRKAAPGDYQYTVRGNIAGKGHSVFSKPKQFRVK